MLGDVVFSTLRTFLADNAGIGLPLGIERVIRIGSKLDFCHFVKLVNTIIYKGLRLSDFFNTLQTQGF